MRGRGGFGGRGGFNGGGRGGRGGYGGGGRGGRGNFDRNGRNNYDAPKKEVGTYEYTVDDQSSAVYKLSSTENVPLTRAYLFDAQGTKVGSVGDVFGPITEVYFNCVPDDKNFLKNLKKGDKIYAGQDKLHPESFFLDDAPKRGGRGGGRGGRGGGRGGRGGRGGGGRGGRY